MEGKFINYYSRKINYYETDAMRIVHHSNYIRWFEEARIDFLEKSRLSLQQNGGKRNNDSCSFRIMPV